MLYVTTRSKNDVFTAPRAINLDCGPDGGLFIPFHLPEFSRHEICALSEKSFGQNVADIMNLFFSTKFTGTDVDKAIGILPLRHVSMNYRIIVSELWHNQDHHFERTVSILAARLHPDELAGEPSNWVQTAVRIAVLFGVFGELQKFCQVRADTPVDVALPCGSFSAPMAAWYGRKMGLPIGTIICGCNENSALWELLHRGQLDTGALAVQTNTPEHDFAVPPDLERLICETCGQEEAKNYFWSCTEGGTYLPEEQAWEAMRKGMSAAVISRAREGTIIPNVYRTSQYILDPYSALAYGALSDYRAKNGSSRTVLLICEKSPVCYCNTVAESMGITTDELKKRISEM